jgi:hypothetical protein
MNEEMVLIVVTGTILSLCHFCMPHTAVGAIQELSFGAAIGLLRGGPRAGLPTGRPCLRTVATSPRSASSKVIITPDLHLP